MNQAQSESISAERQNVPGQKIKDKFVGITSKMVYQKPNPRLKTQFEENLKCFINKKASTATAEAN